MGTFVLLTNMNCVVIFRISTVCELLAVLTFMCMHPNPPRRKGVVRIQFGRTALMDASPEDKVRDAQE